MAMIKEKNNDTNTVIKYDKEYVKILISFLPFIYTIIIITLTVYLGYNCGAPEKLHDDHYY